jgi:hypothetical protein
MDEPTNGLDPIAGRSVRQLLHDFCSEGRLLICSTHYLHEAVELAERVILLHKGRILANESVAAICSRAVGRTMGLRTTHDPSPVLGALNLQAHESNGFWIVHVPGEMPLRWWGLTSGVSTGKGQGRCFAVHFCSVGSLPACSSWSSLRPRCSLPRPDKR